MLRSILVFVSLSVYLFSGSNLYTVKLGVYHNQKSLLNMINQYSPALKRTVITYKQGKLTVASTLPTENRAILKKLLPAYKKIFTDAYITHTARHKKDVKKRPIGVRL